MNPENVITIKILERFYKIKCTPQESLALQEAAQYLDDQMKKIRQSGPISSPDKMIVVVALNIYCELLRLKKQKDQNIESMMQRIQALQEKIDTALSQKDPLLEETIV